MNWLTVLMATVDSFRDMHEVAVPRADSTLRRVPFELVESTLAAAGVTVDISPVMESMPDAYLFSEEHQAAMQRINAARASDPDRSPDERPLRFTVGLHDGQGTVVWLPDDDDDVDMDLQVFIGLEDGRVDRLRMRGRIAPGHTRVTALERLPPATCSDGPCVEWGERCGAGGCLCQKFSQLVERARLRLHGGGRTQIISVLRCDLD